MIIDASQMEYHVAFGYAYGRQDEVNKDRSKSSWGISNAFAAAWAIAHAQTGPNGGRSYLPSMFEAYDKFIQGEEF